MRDVLCARPRVWQASTLHLRPAELREAQSLLVQLILITALVCRGLPCYGSYTGHSAGTSSYNCVQLCRPGQKLSPLGSATLMNTICVHSALCHADHPINIEHNVDQVAAMAEQRTRVCNQGVN